MSYFQIISSAGVDMGIYEGASPNDALDAMARDAGYRDAADAAEVTGEWFDGAVAELSSKPLQGRV
jgi:hypothetical protein